MIDLTDLDVGTLVDSVQVNANGAPKVSGLVVDVGMDVTGERYVTLLTEKDPTHVVTMRPVGATQPKTVYTATLRRMAVADIASVDVLGRDGSALAVLMRYGVGALTQVAASASTHLREALTEAERELHDAARWCFRQASQIIAEMTLARLVAREGRP